MNGTRSHRIHDFTWAIGWLLVISSLSSCYEAIEGCLDAKASNFDFSADKNCDDCCNYPNVILNLNPMFGVQEFHLDSIYVNNQGKELILTEHFYLVSNISVSPANGMQLSTNDSVWVECTTQGIPIHFSNTFRCVELSTQLISLLDFRHSGNYQLLQFELGFDPCLGSIDSSSLEENSDLASIVAKKSIGTGNEIVVQHFRFVSPENALDTIEINIAGSESWPIIQLPIDAANNNGENLQLEMFIDYGEWFKDLDLSTDSPGILHEKIKSNISGVFAVN